MNHQFFNGSSRPNRSINLSSQADQSKSHLQVLRAAREERESRDLLRKQNAAATSIQAAYRSWVVRKGKKAEWRRDVVQGKEVGVGALRRIAFVGLGGGDDGLGKDFWAAAGAGSPPSILLPLHARSPSHAVLLKTIVLNILKLASASSRYSLLSPQLSILPLILSPSSYASILPEPDAQSFTLNLITDLNRSSAVSLITKALSNLSSTPTDKKHPNIPPLIETLSHLLSDPSPSCLSNVLFSLLRLPLLPNRLPIPSLTRLARSLPLEFLLEFALSPEGSEITSKWGRDDRLNAVGNISAFGSPKVAGWSSATKLTWSRVLGGLLGGLDASIDGKVSETSSTAASPVSPKLLSHLELLVAPVQITALLSPQSSPPVLAFLLSLVGVWPSRRDRILSAVVSKRGVLKDLWRGSVRNSPLMRKVLESSRGATSVITAIRDTSLSDQWSSLLLLTLLHIHLLHSLGDDEFFSPLSNPLSLDETVELSGLFRTIAFSLYWNGLPENWLACGWSPEDVRGLMERAMQGVYERDLRRPFTPEKHWLMTEDSRSFIDAAISEEKSIVEMMDQEDAPMDVDSDNFLPPPITRPKRSLGKRQLASISPRLGVLNNIPQTVPFDVRVEIFRAFIRNDRTRLGIDRYAPGARRYEVTIRRDRVAEDGYAHLNALGAGLKGTISITFLDSLTQTAEAGIDGGGVFKEFLTSLANEVFDTKRGLWGVTTQNELFPSPTKYATESHQLNWFQFLGRVLGKALYEGILTDVTFARFFVNKWLGRQSYLDDLSSLDPELYTGLIKLKQYDGNVEDLALTFTLDTEEFGATSTVELVPNGQSVAVTKENRLQYIDLVASYKLNTQIKLQCEAFLMGLTDIIEPRWLKGFDSQELRMLVGGVDTEIDIDDLQANTVVSGLPEHTERAFWQVVRSFDSAQRRALVKFVTSCPRPPMLGFKELEPQFGLRAAANDVSRLPTASSCFNLLKLPPYRDAATLRSKLLQAIDSDSGFDLS